MWCKIIRVLTLMTIITQTLTIKATDIDGNIPKFELPDYQAHDIDEEILLNTNILKVEAFTGNSGTHENIEYLVRDDRFKIDHNGVISNKQKLDADYNGAFYQFPVIARNKGDHSKNGTATVRIYMKNKNDEMPEFSAKVYTSEVEENVGPNTLVTTVAASDKDGDNVRYNFAGGTTTSGQFVIDGKTGVIRLRDDHISLDRDKYELNVTATDDGACCHTDDKNHIHTSTAMVIVSIVDINDNKPIFNNCSNYSPTVEEGAVIGTSVIKVQATDLDRGMNGQVRYSLVKHSNAKDSSVQPFTIDNKTGEISTNKVFDREGENGRFQQITVKATDQSANPLEGVCSFTVAIKDINDNAPLFDRSEYVEIVKQDMEIGTKILKVSASDLDAGNNAQITYKLTSAPQFENDLEYFDIQSESGWIELRKSLGENGTYHLRVKASDKGNPPLFALTNVELHVVNRNNERPLWDQDVFGPISIKENVPSFTLVTSIKASSGIKNDPAVTYQIINGFTPETNHQNTFFLERRVETTPEGKLFWADIKVHTSLDYESFRNYKLTIRAENKQKLASETTIHIDLEDVNDGIPLILPSEQAIVNEGEPPGTPVTKVTAIDDDGTYPNNHVTYHVKDNEENEGKDYFVIDKNTGEIFTKVVLDRETKAVYILDIEARDGAISATAGIDKPNSVSGSIKIKIGDKNDNPPYFDKPLYVAEVDENKDINDTILTVNANDPDENSKIRYKITGGNICNVFAVEEKTGNIHVAAGLDYESTKMYNLTLAASDGHDESYTTVIINIKDVNDKPPVFDKSSYSISVTEEELPENLPKIIFKVKAIDGDVDRPQNIVYSLEGQGRDSLNEANSIFNIDSVTGEIRVLKSLNRDYPNGRPQWRLTVSAQDEGGSGLTGYADLLIIVKDINDNAPQFSKGVHVSSVTENGTEGMFVMTMTAVDYDDINEGTNAKLKYSIEKNAFDEKTRNPIFAIDPDDGAIRTAVCCLDREKIAQYYLQILAVDGGGLRGTGTALIKVKDVNDMPPRFTKETWYVEVDETDGKMNLPVLPILKVTVQDEDETNNFRYKVIENSGVGADKFQMVRNNDGTGSLQIIQQLDFEDSLPDNQYNFTIQVNDKGEDDTSEKYHVAYSRVIVKLRDINDNAPNFEKSIIEVEVFENVTVGTVLTKFKAIDPDQGGKSKVSYHIDRTSDRRGQFLINEDGVVSVRSGLDREKTSNYQVRILAKDDGIPQKTGIATLRVTVRDCNDNAPRFLKDYRPVLPENVEPKVEIQEIYAIDDDDETMGNGPPFFFQMDPKAPVVIKDSFEVEYNRNGADGAGTAIVRSLRKFDREQEREYHIPIIISDSGSPKMSGTSTLTVVIGDENDNEMKNGGLKNVVVYNYEDQLSEIEIGTVYTSDQDDWISPDLKFSFCGDTKTDNFALDSNSGKITIKPNKTGLITEKKYSSCFTVVDNKYKNSVSASLEVTVKRISHDAVMNSGSIRINGITEQDFITIWDYKNRKVIKSRAELLKIELAKIFKVEEDKIDIFSVQRKGKNPFVIDIRYYVDGMSTRPRFLKPTKLDGLVLMNREEIERKLNINITMIGINECLYENENCDGSCTNLLEASKDPYMVDAGMSSLIGIRMNVIAKCTCAARNFGTDERCKDRPCYNGGNCTENSSGITCTCRPGSYGPRCQETTRSFGGNGWAWYPALEMCNSNELSLEFITTKANGQLLYNGPIGPPESEEVLVSDFISLELDGGSPRLLIDFGSGTRELKINVKNPLNDGKWHRLDISWETESVQMTVDSCKFTEISKKDNGTFSTLSLSSCHAKSDIPAFSEYLNVNTPLQIGGMYVQPIDPAQYGWTKKPMGKGFEGCIKNLVYNRKLYDLADPGLSENSNSGCPETEICSDEKFGFGCGEHGTCIGDFNHGDCECDPGWTGPHCKTRTTPTTFKNQSYVKYALMSEVNKFSTQLQLRFRTRENHGELFRVNDQFNRNYAILEIMENRLQLRYNLNSETIYERIIRISGVAVTDGNWHIVKVSRYGSAVELKLDGGEGKQLNGTYSFEGHQWLFIDRLEGIYAGGKAKATGYKTFEVYAGLKNGCLDDIRLDGKNLPLPPASNETRWAQAIESQNLEKDCKSNSPCANIFCPSNLMCTDDWNNHNCTCGPGSIFSSNNPTCINKNECMDFPCWNGGICVDREPEYLFDCFCPFNYYGRNCYEVELPSIAERNQQQEVWRLGIRVEAIIAFLLCVLILILLILAACHYRKVKESTIMYKDSDIMLMQNILPTEDGEDEPHLCDISILQIPIIEKSPKVIQRPVKISPNEDVKPFIEYQMEKQELNPNNYPMDDLRNYAYEGEGSIADDLSSLDSDSDDDLDFRPLGLYGPKFDVLGDIYSPDGSEEEKDENIVPSKNPTKEKPNYERKLKETPVDEPTCKTPPHFSSNPKISSESEGQSSDDPVCYGKDIRHADRMINIIPPLYASEQYQEQYQAKLEKWDGK